MIVLVFVIILILAVSAVVYQLYRGVFCYPVKKHADVHSIPDSKLYAKYRDSMLECVEDIEKTPCEEVHIASQEGFRLYGRLFYMKEGAPTVIFFHGYHGTAEWDGYGLFKVCKNYEINILMIDERAHGKSEGTAITFGIKERYDCKLWAEYVAGRFGENADIILAGVSMGAASIIMASELGLPANVKGLIADCGYSEPAAIIKETIRTMKLPVKPVYQIIRLGTAIFGRFDLEEATVIQAVKKLNIPILFIHGNNDSVVPVSMCEELYENVSGKKEIFWADGADHANSAITDYEGYEKAVVSFLNGLK